MLVLSDHQIQGLAHAGLLYTCRSVLSGVTYYVFYMQELRDVYARVFFHIREYYTFFKRLQDGHSAML